MLIKTDLFTQMCIFITPPAMIPIGTLFSAEMAAIIATDSYI